MKNTNPLEKDIERRVCQFAKEKKFLCYKFTSPAQSHVPDRIFITPAGVVFMIEFKRKGKKPTPAQEIEIAKIRATGVQVNVVDNVGAGKQLIDRMEKVKQVQHDPSVPFNYEDLIIQNEIERRKLDSY